MKKVFVLLMVITAMTFSAYAQDLQSQSSSTATTVGSADQTTTTTVGTAAQTTTTTITGTADQTATTTTTVGTAQGTANQQQADLSLMRQKASELIGYNIVDAQGKKIGDVKDLVITSEGKVPYVAAGFDNVNTDGNILVPIKAFKFGTTQDNKQGAVLSVSQDQLKNAQNAPVIKGDQLAAGYDEKAMTFWKGSVAEGDMVQAQSGQAFLASKLLDYDVKGTDNKNIGNVKDIMVDLEKMEVAYVAMGVGGFLGIGEDLYAIPMSDFKINTDGKDLSLNAIRSLFDDAKGFDTKSWPAQASTNWQQDIQSQKQALGSGDKSTGTGETMTTTTTIPSDATSLQTPNEKSGASGQADTQQ